MHGNCKIISLKDNNKIIAHRKENHTMPCQINIERTKTPKKKPDQNNLGFGKYFTDHMFVMDYSTEKGWHDPRIVPYSSVPFEPSTMVFHYGQAVFEGLKAFKTKNGKVLLFRPMKNMERLNISNDRLCIPLIDANFAIEAIKTLIKIDEDWIPSCEGTSLYIRPFIIATDPYLGVRPSDTYKFFIILSPVGAYYPEGIKPVKIYVEDYYVRSTKGGLGNVKAAGNYAASLKAQYEASKKGYTQVLWLDGIEKKYVEEVGTMNVFFVINKEVITPSLEGTILPGVTRDSVLQLLKSFKITATERRITIDEIFHAHENGDLNEAFGTGTAAVISPIGGLTWKDKTMIINNEETGEISRRLYKYLTGIQNGEIEDSFGWTMEV